VLGEASVQVVMWQQFIIWENQVYGFQYLQSFEMGEDLVEWTGSMSFQLYFHSCRSVCTDMHISNKPGCWQYASSLASGD
jgi:hypothetical protein